MINSIKRFRALLGRLQQACWMLVFLLSSAWGASAMASPSEGSDWGIQTKSHWMVGVDAWSLLPSATEDSSPNSGVWDNTWLMLPNAATEHTFRSVSPLLRYQADVTWSSSLSTEMKFRADQNLGEIFDELALTWRPSPSLGARIGVLDFKTTWCRTYDVDSPWIREPDSFCTFSQIKDSVAGAPGMQLFVQNHWHQHVVSMVVGVYDPMLLDYDTNEFSNFYTSPNMRVSENQKMGLSLSWLNAFSGNEIRASWLHSKQVAQDVVLVDGVRQSANLLYLGATQHVGDRHQIRYVFNRFESNRRFGYLPTQEYPRMDILSLPDSRDSHAVEWLYQLNARDRLSLGASLFEMYARQTLVEEGQTYISDPFFTLEHHGVYVGWRRELNKQMFFAAQAMWVDQRHEYFDMPRQSASHGQAFGLRWAYRY